MLVDQLLAAIATMVRAEIALAQRITFGAVVGTSPLQVRFNGDTDAVEIDLVAAGYTPQEDDTVALIRVGDDWVAAYAVVSA